MVFASCVSRAESGGSVSPTPGARAIAFVEVVSTAQARDDSGPTLMVGTRDASRAEIAQLVPGANVTAGRVMVAVFQGRQSTGGYSVRITAVERSGDQLVVRATFTRPAPGALVTQVLTAPAEVVSIDATAVAGLHVAILLDENAAEVARINTT